MISLQQFSENLYLTEQTALDMSVRGAVLLGKSKAFVFDTLMLPKDMEAVQILCENRKITVVYSHADWDHIWGTCALEYSEVIAHELCLERFNDPEDVAKTLGEYQQKYPQDLSDVRLIAPTTTFKDTFTLSLDELSLELTHLPGHSKDCIVAFIPSEGVLLGGDCLEHPMPIMYEDSPLNLWISNLQLWAQDERVKTVIPCHGAWNGKHVLLDNLAYLKTVQAGEPFEIAYELDEFYSKVHADNKRLAPLLE